MRLYRIHAIAAGFFCLLTVLSLILTNTQRTWLVARLGVLGANHWSVALPVVFGLATVFFVGTAIWSKTRKLGSGQTQRSIGVGKLVVLNANTTDRDTIKASLAALASQFAPQRAQIDHCHQVFDSFTTLVQRLDVFLLANPQVQFESAKDIIGDAHRAICNKLVRTINSGAMFDSINASTDFANTLGKTHHDIAEWLATVDQLVSVVLDSTSDSGDSAETRKLADFYIQQLRDLIPGSEAEK